MCKTSLMRQQPSSCLRRAAEPANRHKRARDGFPTTSPRTKRVTFSTREDVLGTAQDYDRTSFEAEPSPARTAFHAGDASTAAPAVVRTMRDEQANFCGLWRRSHGFNWAALLELSGVDRAAIPEQAAKMQASSVVHLIDHDDVTFRLTVHSDSGNTQDQQFFIGGQPRPNPASSNATSTLANMRWASNGRALVLTSVDAASGDEMTVSRHLAYEGTVMVQHYRARCASTGETAEAVTIFRRMVR